LPGKCSNPPSSAVVIRRICWSQSFWFRDFVCACKMRAVLRAKTCYVILLTAKTPVWIVQGCKRRMSKWLWKGIEHYK
jgi:hypothetical protein